MGNYVSCTLAVPLIKTSRAARVVFPGGEIRQFRQPIKAAELMFECPGFFLENSTSLHIGRRFSPLSADEELEFGKVYVMFPMNRMNSIATAADMTVFFMAANSAAKRISDGKASVLPENGGEEVSEEKREIPAGDLQLSFQRVEGFPIPEYKYRVGVCRSRKPLLETIKEEPVRLRRWELF